MKCPHSLFVVAPLSCYMSSRRVDGDFWKRTCSTNDLVCDDCSKRRQRALGMGVTLPQRTEQMGVSGDA
jgi:hypothetical protein